MRQRLQIPRLRTNDRSAEVKVPSAIGGSLPACCRIDCSAGFDRNPPLDCLRLAACCARVEVEWPNCPLNWTPNCTPTIWASFLMVAR